MTTQKYFFILICITITFAGEQLSAIRTDSVITLDGILDEPAWLSAPGYDQFINFDPEPLTILSEKTSVYLVYDDHNLYFGLECADSRPHEIAGSLTKWDNIFDGDWAGVILDGFNDGESAYEFYVNSFGSQGDLIMNPDGNDDTSPDFFWQAGARRHGAGYTLEIQIPLKSIRFPQGKQVKMGITFLRKISRSSEKATFPALDPEGGGFLEQMATVVYEGLKFEPTYEILPSFTAAQFKERQDGKLVTTLEETEFGVTGKAMLTPTVILDATVNPDFSQVEADAGQVDINLRDPIFFQEKRSFFMEGNEKFRFAGLWETSGVNSVMHTRNIVEPYWGLKISGKFGIRNSIAVLSASDRSEPDSKGDNTLFSVIRYKRLFSSATFGGLIFNQKTNADYDNKVAGGDFNYKVSGVFSISGNVLVSEEKKKNETLNGWSSDLLFDYGDKRNSLVINLSTISRDFRIASGWAPRTGMSTVGWWVSRNFYPQSDWLNRIMMGFWGYYGPDDFYDLDEHFILLIPRFYLPYYTVLRLDFGKGIEVYENRQFSTSKIAMELNGQAGKNISYYLNLRTGLSTNYEDMYTGRQNSLTLDGDYRLGNQLTVSATYTRVIFYHNSTDEKIWDYELIRSALVYQLNKYLLIRCIGEYNLYDDEILADVLISFRYFAGSVMHLGYGTLYHEKQWDQNQQEFIPASSFTEANRGLFFKISYNWRI